MLEYVWTRALIKEEETPPGPGWQYYGGCIRGTREDPTASVWRLTRWAKKEGDTTKFELITTRPKGRNWALEALGTYTKKEISAREKVLALLKNK